MIHHVQLASPAGSEDASRAFYSGVLGLAELDKPPALARRGGCWFRGHGIELHLGIEAEFRPARKAHPAFIVDDLAALSAKLTKAGHVVTSDEPLKGYTRVYIDDPFGNRIELMQPE